LHRARVPALFRGDSHLLDGASGLKWLLKRSLLRTIYRWPTAFLYVGQANRNCYERLGVPASKLFHCPHSIDVSRFAEPHEKFESDVQAWRARLGLANKRVLLFAGKFEPKKQPLQLMDACIGIDDPAFVLAMVGDGVLAPEVARRAAAHPERFRVLSFQNQSKMPLVYRLGDVFTLPSAWGETWGLAVNEALACGRPVLVSDKVGCASDVVQPGVNGYVFPTGDWPEFRERLSETLGLAGQQSAIQETARHFDIPETERTLIEAVRAVVSPVEEKVPQVPLC
jgi:glycosyltransferase involved in cell wall biosynthesis